MMLPHCLDCLIQFLIETASLGYFLRLTEEVLIEVPSLELSFEVASLIKTASLINAASLRPFH